MHTKILLLAILFGFQVSVVAEPASVEELEKELSLDDLGESGESTSKAESKKPAEKNNEDSSKGDSSSQENVSQNAAPSKSDSKSKTVSKDTTKVDFDAALIEGERKAPDNMFLSGQIKQDLMQMINLRRDFRNELKNSGQAVRALVK